MLVISQKGTLWSPCLSLEFLGVRALNPHISSAFPTGLGSDSVGSGVKISCSSWKGGKPHKLILQKLLQLSLPFLSSIGRNLRWFLKFLDLYTHLPLTLTTSNRDVAVRGFFTEVTPVPNQLILKREFSVWV